MKEKIYLSIYLSINLSIYLSIYLSIRAQNNVLTAAVQTARLFRLSAVQLLTCSVQQNMSGFVSIKPLVRYLLRNKMCVAM